MESLFLDILNKSGNSKTKPRVVVFDILKNREPTSVAKIASLVGPAINRATVYRTIELFENLGIVNKVWHGFKSKFELSELFTPHHHHAICKNCGKTIIIHDERLENLLEEIVAKKNAKLIEHSIELSVLCAGCN